MATKTNTRVKSWPTDEVGTFIGWLHSFYGKPKKKNFSAEDKRILRPVAEILAIMDGNAFFGMTKDANGEDTWYEQYLPEAYQIFKGQGGYKGWMMETSWAREVTHENAAVKEAYEQWQLLKILSRNSN